MRIDSREGDRAAAGGPKRMRRTASEPGFLFREERRNAGGRKSASAVAASGISAAPYRQIAHLEKAGLVRRMRKVSAAKDRQRRRDQRGEMSGAVQDEAASSGVKATGPPPRLLSAATAATKAPARERIDETPAPADARSETPFMA